MSDLSAIRFWVQQHVSAHPAGTCAEVTAALVAAFPALRRVRGHYFCPLTGQRYPHWWCETAEGRIIDPTAAQFPSHGVGGYEEHTGPEPTGKCPNCGGYVYDGGTCCSVGCTDAYARYVYDGEL